MQSQRYKQELDNIQASEEFKENTKELLRLELQQPAPQEEQEPAKKRIQVLLRPRRIAAVAAAVVLLVGSVAVLKNAASFLGEQYGGAMQKAAALPEAAFQYSTANEAGARASTYFSGGVAEDAALTDGALNEPQPAGGVADSGKKSFEELPRIVLETPVQGQSGVFYQYGIENVLSDWPLDEAEAAPQALPVYSNTYRQTSSGYVPDGLSQTEMEALLWEQAQALALEIEAGELETGYVPTEVGGEATGLYSVAATAADATTITVLRSGEVNIVFGSPLVPGAGTAPGAEEGLPEHEAYLDKLIQEYSLILGGMQSPRGVAAQTRKADGTPAWTYWVYDEKEDQPWALYLNRSTSGLLFTVDEAGRLAGLTLRRADTLPQKGKCPVIARQSAEQRLLAGDGYSFAEGAKTPTQGQIAQTDLIYLYIPEAQFVLPHYKFYIETGKAGDGLAQYTEWYLPAVDFAYLAP